MAQPSGSQSADIKVLIVEIQGLREDISEIKTDVKCLSERQVEFERHYTGEHVKIESQTQAANRRLDILEPKVEKLDETVRQELKNINATLSPLHLQAKVMVWIAAVLGVSIIGLIFSIVFGQAEVIFR